MFATVKMTKMRHREAKELVQDHTMRYITMPDKTQVIPNVIRSGVGWGVVILSHLLDIAMFLSFVVQLLSHIQLFALVGQRSVTAAGQTPLSFAISQSLLKFMSIELVVLSNHLIL